MKHFIQRFVGSVFFLGHPVHHNRS